MDDSILGLLSNPDEAKRMKKEMMRRQMEAQQLMSQVYGDERLPIDLDAQINAVPDIRGFAGGGRIGTQIPLTPEQMLILGLSGGGTYSPKDIAGRRFMPNSLDAMLQTPSGGYGFQLNRKDPYNPTLPRLMLNYNRQF